MHQVERPSVILHMEGGVIQSVTVSQPIDVMVIVYDDIVDQSVVCMVDTGDESDLEPAWVTLLSIDVDPEYNASRLAKFAATDGKEC
ncbi:MAG: hypothetical protein ACOH2T_18995 [Pseudomonas sp.]